MRYTCAMKKEILKKYFGHSRFRPLQEEVVDAILDGQDLLMILPTGGGKSLCYQLPTLMMDGVTVVISPLLALMHDQVTALRANEIEAAMLSSMQSMEECRQIEMQLLDGSIRLLYVAPERFANNYFVDLLRSLNINFFVVDEAHCVSEWGHEFREDYRKLSLLKNLFPDTPVAAFTATATKAVEHDIVSQLKLHDTKLVRGDLFRENLNIEARYRVGDGKAQLMEFLRQHSGESGIIYTLSRKSTESVASYLNSRGISAEPYHAGLSSEQKNSTYADFAADRVQIVVATIAFGMGIDKSNIRFVVHMTLPKTLENYYQEIGRAGRDGLDSDVLLLFSASDMIQQRSFIDDLPDSPYKELAYAKLEQMMRFADGESCRHQVIARYFGDDIDECAVKCDNCTTPESSKVDITEAAQKLLAAVYRTGQNFGLHYIIDILRQSRDKRVLQNGHDLLSVYGVGKEYSKAQWLSIGDRLLEIGAMKLGDFKVCKLTSVGADILKGKKSVEMKEERLNAKKSIKAKKVTVSDDYDTQIFEKLRSLRSEIAERDGVPPYIVFSDKTLKDLSVKLPETKEEMLQVHGIGEIKFDKYGNEFLNLLAAQ